MLLRVWHIVIEFFLGILDRDRSAHTGSQYGNDRFNGRYQGINSPLITGSKVLATSNSSKAVLLPKELKSGNHTCLSKEEFENHPESQDVIKVSYVEGEFLSKSLDARNSGRRRARTNYLFAAALVLLVFVGIKSNFQVHAFKNAPENRVVNDNMIFKNNEIGIGSRGEKALSESELPVEALTIANAKPVSQQNQDLSKTDIPYQNLDQTILPSTEAATHSDVKVGAVLESESFRINKATVENTTNVPSQAYQVDRSNPKSHKSTSASHEGVSSESKKTASIRNQKDRTHPTSTGRSSSGAVPETVVNGVLGGLAGAVVGGPVGLIAGATVGATAGKAIARSWGLR